MSAQLSQVHSCLWGGILDRSGADMGLLQRPDRPCGR
jgi:hypothetical protein